MRKTTSSLKTLLKLVIFVALAARSVAVYDNCETAGYNFYDPDTTSKYVLRKMSQSLSLQNWLPWWPLWYLLHNKPSDRRVHARMSTYFYSHLPIKSNNFVKFAQQSASAVLMTTMGWLQRASSATTPPPATLPLGRHAITVSLSYIKVL